MISKVLGAAVKRQERDASESCWRKRCKEHSIHVLGSGLWPGPEAIRTKTTGGGCRVPWKGCWRNGMLPKTHHFDSAMPSSFVFLNFVQKCVRYWTHSIRGITDDLVNEYYNGRQKNKNHKSSNTHAGCCAGCCAMYHLYVWRCLPTHWVYLKNMYQTATTLCTEENPNSP